MGKALLHMLVSADIQPDRQAVEKIQQLGLEPIAEVRPPPLVRDSTAGVIGAAFHSRELAGRAHD